MFVLKRKLNAIRILLKAWRKFISLEMISMICRDKSVIENEMVVESAKLWKLQNLCLIKNKLNTLNKRTRLLSKPWRRCCVV